MVYVLVAIVSDRVGSVHKKTSSVLTSRKRFDTLLLISEEAVITLTGCDRFFVYLLSFPIMDIAISLLSRRKLHRGFMVDTMVS